MSDRIKFLKEAFVNIKTLGTITPSSRFLSKRMLKEIDFSSVKVIVELGAGNGAITKFILKNLPPKAILICFEINNNFFSQLQVINHPQLILLKSSAENIEIELQKLNVNTVDFIISSLPLTIIPDNISEDILQKSYKVLDKNGSFIQYQYSLTYLKKLNSFFKDAISLGFEPLNIPPAFIYRCKKVE